MALPTETVYGLGASALNAAAVARIYQVKGRPATSPLIVHVSDTAMARRLVTKWPDAAGKLAARFWPGPLTLVLPKAPSVPDIVTAGLQTVGLRMPAHPLALAVIERSGEPIAAPSANRFMALSPTTAEHVRRSLGNDIDMILDGGPCQVGIESTVLSLAGPEPVLLRPGAISRTQIEAVLGVPVLEAGAVEGAHPSPGMHARHYSPRTRLLLTGPEGFPMGRGAYLWRERPAAAELTIAMPPDPESYAQRLYDALHTADAAGLDWIAVEPLPHGPEWEAIADRISRAARPL